MPLPEEVINRLSEDRPTTPGWSSGILGFSLALLGVCVVVYAVMVFVYQPYVTRQLNAATAQAASIDSSPVIAQAGPLATFYSQVIHIQGLLRKHVAFSQFMTWLEKSTQTNVYYGSLSFTSGNQVVMTVLGRTEADVNQQIAIFQSDPSVTNVSVSNVSLTGLGGYWQAGVTLTVSSTLITATGN